MQARACILIVIALISIAPCKSIFQTGGGRPRQSVSLANNLEKFLVESLEAVERDRRSDEDDDDDEDSDDVSDLPKNMKGQSVFLLPNNSLLSKTHVFSSNWGDVFVEIGKLKKNYAMVMTMKSNVQHPAQVYGLMQSFLNSNSLNGNNNNGNRG